MTKKNSYWNDRIDREHKWQEQQLKNDVAFNKQLQQYYNQAIVQINKDIDNQINSLAKRDQVSYAEAQKVVSTTDITDYETEARKVVQEANRLRAQGKRVTYNNFSDEVNQRMRRYNATMRINRLEYIKSQIGLSMVEAGMNIDSDMQAKVADDYRQELKRQSGILVHSAENSSLWTSQSVAKQITKQINGATFSQRIWANQDALKARLDEVITNGILTGKNPRVVAKQLKDNVRKTVKDHSYVTERIARTESARVQYSAQIESIKKNGYQFVQWIAEPRACQECRQIATQDNGYGDGVYRISKVPRIPEDTHPNCRCSISETWVDGQENLSSNNLKSFKELMDTDIKDLSEKDIRIIGRELYAKLSSEGSKRGNQIEKLRANFKKLNEAYDNGQFKSYDDYLEQWQMTSDAIRLIGDQQADAVANEISKYRSVGSPKLAFQKRSSVSLKKLILNAYEHYPTDWSINAEKRNTLKVISANRGYYSDEGAEIAANKNSYNAQSTMYHELGHREEHTNPEVMRLEGEFYNRRTKGENPQQLSVLTGNSNYCPDEMAKPDKFKSVYMGKKYENAYNHEVYGYELLSMGVEGIYQARYNLYEDRDMAEFILGLLLKG
jgi:SPP1 gp7 family putative phage head morphogenesis protein